MAAGKNTIITVWFFTHKNFMILTYCTINYILKIQAVVLSFHYISRAPPLTKKITEWHDENPTFFHFTRSFPTLDYKNQARSRFRSITKLWLPKYYFLFTIFIVKQYCSIKMPLYLQHKEHVTFEAVWLEISLMSHVTISFSTFNLNHGVEKSLSYI